MRVPCKSVLHAVLPLLCININYTGIIYTVLTVGFVHSQIKGSTLRLFYHWGSRYVAGLNLPFIKPISEH